MILDVWDANRGGAEALLLRQRKQAKGGGNEEAKRTMGCMLRLLNVLFSDRFFEEFIATGNQLSREQIDQGGSLFAMFEDINASFSLVHSAAKMKRMWKEVSGNFASAEAKSKVSRQGSNDFWDFCGGRADVYYIDQWCEHRGDGHEFCVANIYAANGDDSTKEGPPSKQTVNRKRRKSSQSSDILEREQRVAQKLTTLYAMLDRNNTVTQQFLTKRHEYIAQGRDAAEIEEALASLHQKQKTLELRINQLECDIVHGTQ
ncbi:hypothetical protein GN958_ATG21353 [Phytophthora infestans]|uniref:Uncharacterized protein n=1 Tax=Phytophthora infestans TaxID=4787 RepID=A0A8S9TR54_PHYIN|nr:hypothetical protein GN958_ATG21352 [Phytophthora infestans]KAF4129398.1 hypothetical protein GN958_ATG21353 [Phytophthora infestans]